jgi:release factor glutamine methyltransferase
MKNPLLSDITNRLASISRSPALEASVLLAHVAGKPRTWVLAHPELTLSNEQDKKLNHTLTRLEHGEPFPYVLGYWEFFGLDLKVTPDVLIPRPETELLIEKAIAWLNMNPTQQNIADVGTGSGAIAISLAVNLPDANILATDISSNALNVAKHNAEKHGVSGRVNFIECDLLPQASIENRRFEIDVVCANLPYIPTKTLQELPVFGREPTLALDGGSNGFELIQQLMQIAPEYLSPNSLMLFEVEETLGREAVALAHHFFPKAMIELHRDLTGRDRLLQIQLP